MNKKSQHSQDKFIDVIVAIVLVIIFIAIGNEMGWFGWVLPVLKWILIMITLGIVIGVVIWKTSSIEYGVENVKIKDEIDRIKELLKDYEPPPIRDEKEFERSFYSHLKAKDSNMKIQFQQKLTNGGRIDILIDNQIGIELKIAESKNHLRSLIGQVEEYLEVLDKLLIVILDVGYLDRDTIVYYIKKFEKKGAVAFVVKGKIKRHNLKKL